MIDAVSFLHHDAQGRIVQVGTCARADLPLQDRTAEGLARLAAAADLDRDYVALSGPEPVVAPRPALGAGLAPAVIAADGAAVATITGLPAGTRVTVRRAGGLPLFQGTVDDGVFAFTTDQAGVYAVHLEHFPHLDQSLEITAHAL